MQKITLFFLMLCVASFGMSYEKFKKYALKQTKGLQAQKLTIAQNKEQNFINLRTSNPTLKLGIGQFSPTNKSFGYGYNFSISQNVKTDKYLLTLKDNAKAKQNLSKIYFMKQKAFYIKVLEDTYTQYVYESKLYMLLEESFKLVSKMSHISKERFKNGSLSKVSYLEIKMRKILLQQKMQETKQKYKELYFKLLAQGGFSKKVNLDKSFIYSTALLKSFKIDKININKKILNAQKKVFSSQYNIDDVSFNQYRLSTSLEQEPEETIVSFGISLPLPLFHNREEEKRLSRLKIAQISLQQEQLELNVISQKKILTSAINSLILQYKTVQQLKKEQHSLVNLLTQGYKLSQSALSKKIEAKNSLIETKKLLLKIIKNINYKKIALGLLEGNYNE